MNRLRIILIWTGGLALLAATGIDTLAVLGRHFSIPLRGSIELIQPAIPLHGAHARAILLLERFGGFARRAADRANDLLTAIFLLLVLAGSAWIAADLWGAHEVSEIAGVPWRWMRMAANLLLLLAALAALLRLRARSGEAEE